MPFSVPINEMFTGVRQACILLMSIGEVAGRQTGLPGFLVKTG
jgi:hypothetical protein